MQSNVRVGSTRTPSDHRNARNLVHFAVGLGHIGGTTLVATDDRLNRRVMKTVKDIQKTLARDNVRALYPMGYQRIDNDMSR